MITEQKIFSLQELSVYTRHFLTDDMLLLDIETTGLSATRHFIYCIGCSYRTGSDITIQLFFAKNREQEIEILAALAKLLQTHRTIVTFNGTTFDLPFLKKRYTANSTELLSDPWKDGAYLSSDITSVDLYREACRLKNVLVLPDYKQKSIETFLGCEREDLYSGKELIAQYHLYQKNPSKEQELLHNLLLHNLEDVLGMYDLVELLTYIDFFRGNFQICNISCQSADQKTFCNIRLQPEYNFPQKLTWISEEASLILNGEEALLSFPVHHGFLRHYFPDFKNYYYLPEEDTIIHKSLGTYVDSAHRQKATRENCFLAKECDYLMHTAPFKNVYLRREFHDTASYFELPAWNNNFEMDIEFPESVRNSLYDFISAYLNQLLK